MKFNYTALKSLKNDLLKSNLTKEKRSSEILLPKKNIQIKNVDYFYPKSKIAALNKININIKVNTTVGIVGSTGSGKSTLLDIIIGLLEPSKGQVFIDNKFKSFFNLK